MRARECTGGWVTITTIREERNVFGRSVIRFEGVHDDGRCLRGHLRVGCTVSADGEVKAVPVAWADSHYGR